MAHLGAHAFDSIGGEVVQTVATVFSCDKALILGDFFRLVDFKKASEKATTLAVWRESPSTLGVSPLLFFRCQSI